MCKLDVAALETEANTPTGATPVTAFIVDAYFSPGVEMAHAYAPDDIVASELFGSDTKQDADDVEGAVPSCPREQSPKAYMRDACSRARVLPVVESEMKEVLGRPETAVRRDVSSTHVDEASYAQSSGTETMALEAGTRLGLTPDRART